MCREERTAQEETRDQESSKRMLSLEAGQRQEVEQSKLLLLTRMTIRSRVWIAYFNLSAEQGFMDAASALGHRLLSHSEGKAEHQQMRLPTGLSLPDWQGWGKLCPHKTSLFPSGE